MRYFAWQAAVLLLALGVPIGISMTGLELGQAGIAAVSVAGPVLALLAFGLSARRLYGNGQIGAGFVMFVAGIAALLGGSIWIVLLALCNHAVPMRGGFPDVSTSALLLTVLVLLPIASFAEAMISSWFPDTVDESWGVPALLGMVSLPVQILFLLFWIAG